MKEQIISYLEGPRDYSQGVALYDQFGPNRMLKAKFRQIGECEMRKIEIEVENLDQTREAVEAGADIMNLFYFSLNNISKAQ